MGICWGSTIHNPVSVSVPAPVTDTIHPSLIAGDDAASVVSDNSWLSVASSNITIWVSQVSSSFTSLWGNNAAGDTQFSAATADEAFTNRAIVASENLRAFTFAQLRAATRNFRRDMVVGRGGFGKVYKGWQEEKVPSRGIKKSPIAVKTLDLTSRQGFKEWMAEVNILGRLSHPNLVKLIGYCYENGHFFLVYEFMQHGSLNYLLFGKGSVRPLPWDVRIKVAVGMAKGLAYLHTLEIPVAHRDLKSSNILLDKFYNAKISDFGLAALALSHNKTHAVGTIGYAAPEVMLTGHFHVKSDMYSFGVVLLEILTGLRAIDMKRPSGQQLLVDWVQPFLSNRRKLKTIMDSRLEGRYPSKEASQMAQLAMKCVQVEPKFRPSVKEIVETLEEIEACQHRTTTA